MKTKEQAVLYMIYSSLFLAPLNFSVKMCVAPLGVLESVFLRYFAPLVCVIPVIAWYRRWQELKPQIGFSLHFLRGLCAVVVQLSLNYYLTRATLVNATMMWATGPIFVPIIIRLLYGQRTPLTTWISIIICLMGVALMVKPSHGIFDPFIFWGLLAGVSSAFSQILWGRNMEEGSILENLFYLYVFASGLALIVWLIFGEIGVHSIPSTANLWIAFVGIAISSLGNQWFRSKAYQRVPSFLLSPLLYVAVIGSGIFDVVFFHHWPDVWGYIGFALVCVGTLVKWWYLKENYPHTFS